MTPPTNDSDCKSKKLEIYMEKGFVIAAFAIFLFAMISTLSKPHHEAGPVDADAAHSHGEAPAPAHH